MEDHSFEKEPCSDSEQPGDDDKLNFITTRPMINKRFDKLSNHIPMYTAGDTTRKTDTDSATVPGGQHTNCNCISSQENTETTHSVISDITTLSNSLDKSVENVPVTTNQHSPEHPGVSSQLSRSEEIVSNLPIATQQCLSDCISSTKSNCVNNSDLQNIQMCHGNSENRTKSSDSRIIEGNNDKDVHIDFGLYNHINESEVETQENSVVPQENAFKDDVRSLEFSNQLTSSEQELLPSNFSNIPIKNNNEDILGPSEGENIISDPQLESQHSDSSAEENESIDNDSIDMSYNLIECTVHSLDVIIEEPGESSYASSDSLVSDHSKTTTDNHTGKGVVDTNNAHVPKPFNQCKVPVQQSVPNIETNNKFDKCYSLEENDISSDTSNSSMLRRLESDSDVEIVEGKYDSSARVNGETQSLTYQEESCSTDLLHRSESLDNTYCETSFGTCDMDSGARRWSSRRKCSRHSHDRKESLEQRLRRRFTISDEHKQEVAKRIIALVIKYSLFVFNFCSWVVAAVAVGLGLWVLTDKGQIITDGSDFYLDPTIMVVIVGSITFVVAFLGCVGALRENLLLLKVFFIVLGVIVVIELIIAITIFIMYTVPAVRERFLRSTPEHILRSAIERYMDDDDIKKWIDLIQQEISFFGVTAKLISAFVFAARIVQFLFYLYTKFQASSLLLGLHRCCGVGGMVENNEGYRDWQLNAYFNCTPSNKSIYRCAVPTSCCIFEKGDRVNTMCGFELSDKKVIEVRDYIYTRGCIHGFGEWLSKYDELIVVAALTTLIMQFLAVISAKIMIRRIVKRRQRWGRLRQTSTTSTSSAHV